MKSFKDFNIQPDFPLKGTKESILTLKGKPIIIRDFKFIKQEQNGVKVDACQIQFSHESETVDRVTFTRSRVVRKQLEQVNKESLPFMATFREKEKCLYLD